MAQIQPSIPCNNCGHLHAEVLSERGRDGGALRTVMCSACGLVWSDPFPHDPRRFYEDDYRVSYKGTWQPRAKHVLRAGRVALDRHRKIRPLLAGQSLRVLDVGSGGGEFAYLLASLGHRVTGVEPNRGYAQYSVDTYGLDVQPGFIQDAKLPAFGFGLITIWHVLEHTEDPADVLGRLRGLLSADGRLVVEVPNVEASCQMPSSSFHEAHLFNFNQTSLASMAARVGLALESASLSADGGNLTATFRIDAALTPVPPDQLAANAARVRESVRSHTLARHLLSPHPYMRLARKLVRSAREAIEVRSFTGGRAALDALYSGVVGRDSVARAAGEGEPEMVETVASLRA